MTIHGIAHIQLAIPRGGEDEARRFYSELLGLRELPKPESLLDRGGIWFQCGMQEVHCGIEDPVAPSRRHPAFLVTGLRDLRSLLEAAGIETQDERQLPGYTRFYATDPFGNRLEFMERELR